MGEPCVDLSIKLISTQTNTHQSNSCCGPGSLMKSRTESYPLNKSKISALNTLQADDFLGCARYWVKSEEDATCSYLIEIVQRFFAALYGQPLAITMSVALYIGFTQGRRECLCASWHYSPQKRTFMLWEAADQEGPPKAGHHTGQHSVTMLWPLVFPLPRISLTS